MRTFCMKIDEELYNIIDHYSRRLGVSRSEFVRTALYFFIDKQEEKDKPFISKRIRIYRAW